MVWHTCCDVQVPYVIEQVPIVFNVHCSIGDTLLSKEFYLYPVAGAPVRWSIKSAAESGAGIMCNNPDDFASKIQGMLFYKVLLDGFTDDLFAFMTCMHENFYAMYISLAY